MSEIRPVQLPDKDRPLRADVSLLGSLVGDMLAEQHGPALLERVERVRKASILEREDPSAGDALDQALEGLEGGEAGRVIQAFSYYLRLVNLAEKVHRIRRRREYQRARAAPQRGSLDAILGRLKAHGVSPETLREALSGLDIQPVFTAHPTEATRRTIQEKEYDIVLRLVERLNPERTPDEESVALQRIRAALTSAFQTRLVPHVRPTVADELDNILFYITDILYRVVPVYYESLAAALSSHFDDGLLPDRLLLRFGSWVGGDMDGNPNVNADTIEDTLRAQRRVIVRRYLAEVRGVGRYLSQSLSEVGVSDAVTRRLEHYADAMPGVAEHIPERHRDMPYRRLLRYVSERLEATLNDGPDAYAAAGEFTADLHLIEASLLDNRGEHAGLFALRRLIMRARTFGFHLMTLDVRQDALLHRTVMAEWLADPDWPQRDAGERTRLLAERLASDDFPPLPEGDAASPDLRRTVAVFRALAAARQRYGTGAIGLFIISMTQGADDVLTALALARASVPGGGDSAALDFAPLLETVDDLAAGPGILDDLLRHDAYRTHLDERGGRQRIMVGYSDSNKDSGIAASRWALQNAQGDLLERGRAHGVDIVFFHGRGGTVSRGGGNLVNGILGASPGTVDGYMRLTEQGEVINRKYGVRPIALRNLELITSATLLHTLGVQPWGDDGLRTHEPAPQRHREVMERIATVSRETYRSLVHENPEFPDFFRAITPVDVIERLTIGSRPPARRGGKGIGNLRAIPWVFSWGQTRIGLPGVYGAGTALERAADEFGIERLRELLAEWPFFQALVDDVEMVLAKSDLGIGARYASLVPEAQFDLFENICREFERARNCVLAIKQSEDLLADQDTLKRNIRLRNPYVDPLHRLQVDLLKRWRAGGREDEAMLQSLMASVNGISLGIQNTG
ncbi:phosphoenolpyruvate carboxylase [Elongatibacter sediminis]|uniref:Phosphoenolpyruvate carboxylase n=1 Tax=Elongatibacter sediminis TaxID=3119006 RepID=A0AAW9R700_9GAMM